MRENFFAVAIKLLVSIDNIVIAFITTAITGTLITALHLGAKWFAWIYLPLLVLLVSLNFARKLNLKD